MKGKLFVASTLLLSGLYAADYDHTNGYISLKAECFKSDKNMKLAKLRGAIENSNAVELMLAGLTLSQICVDTPYHVETYRLEEAKDAVSGINEGLIKIAEGK